MLPDDIFNLLSGRGIKLFVPLNGDTCLIPKFLIVSFRNKHLIWNRGCKLNNLRAHFITSFSQDTFQFLCTFNIKRKSILFLLKHKPLSLLFQFDCFFWVMHRHLFVIQGFSYYYVLLVISKHFFIENSPCIFCVFSISTFQDT